MLANGVGIVVPQEPVSYHGHGTTGKNGDVTIPGVPAGQPMMVVMKFGPRFDAFVGKDHPSSGSFDVMKLEGAVYAGKSAHVILADDYEISGKVTDLAGKPLKDVKVFLSDTGFGQMSGYPGTDLDQQTTDASGTYHFKRLPNCVFSVMASAATHMAIESRAGKGPWELRAIVGEQYTSASVWLTSPKAYRDFRISPTARLTVFFRGTPSELKGLTAWIGRDSAGSSGQSLDYDASSSTMTQYTLSGLVTIWLDRDRGEKRFVAKKLTLKPGESRKTEISLADVLKRKRSD